MLAIARNFFKDRLALPVCRAGRAITPTTPLPGVRRHLKLDSNKKPSFRRFWRQRTCIRVGEEGQGEEEGLGDFNNILI